MRRTLHEYDKREKNMGCAGRNQPKVLPCQNKRTPSLKSFNLLYKSGHGVASGWSAAGLKPESSWQQRQGQRTHAVERWVLKARRFSGIFPYHLIMPPSSCKKLRKMSSPTLLLSGSEWIKDGDDKFQHVYVRRYMRWRKYLNAGMSLTAPTAWLSKARRGRKLKPSLGRQSEDFIKGP